jgi:hypothetical protein
VRLTLDKISDALNNILMHKILVGIAYKKQNRLFIYMVIWNALTINKFGFLKLFQFWRLIVSYLSDSSKRDELSAFFLRQFAIDNSRLFLGLMKISTGLGFFEIGSKFNVKHCQSLIYDFEKKKTLHSYKNAIRGIISLGDIERVKLYTDKQKYASFVKQDSVFFESVILFLQICNGSVKNFNCSRSHFDGYINGQNIILLGPAPQGEEFKFLDIKNPIVCRRVGLGADEFFENNNNFSNFKIAYTDLHFINNKIDLSSWIKSTDLDFVVVMEYMKETHILRMARSFNNLFASGAANKIPRLIFDILLGNPRMLYCDGVTFFASEIAYTPDNLDTLPNNVRIDSRGSGGSDFFVSVAMAEHNVFTNRTLVKNLFRNPNLIFSHECKKILLLTEPEYAAQLDVL